MKIIFITNIPNPYRIPLFNEMARQFRESGLELKLVFGAGSYKRRMFQLDLDEIKFEYEILDSKGHTFSKDGEKTLFFYSGLTKLLRKEKPAAIIVAGFSTATLKVFVHKLTNGTPYIIFSGTIESGAGNQSLIRKMQRSLLLKSATAFVAYGNLARKYLLKTGAREEQVFIGRNTVDTTFFAEQTSAIRSQQLPTSSPPRFTYLGYLVPRKNVQLVLQAVKKVSEKRTDFKVDIIGDGISRPALEKYVTDHQLQSLVEFHGFRQKNDLPGFFARSSGLLFQTDFDIWGLVLNEAMAAGVPCLASPNAGATFDLIEEGKTGFVVDFNQPAAIAEKMIWLLDHPEAARQIGMNASAFIREKVTVVHAARGFLEATWYAIKNK